VLIYAVAFGPYHRDATWRRLVTALRGSAALNAPEARLVIENPAAPPQQPPYMYGTTCNLVKMAYWARAAAEATEPLLLLDADMLVLRDPAEVFEAYPEPWDIALTYRPTTAPLNGGAVWIRPGPRAAGWLARWHNRCHEIYRDTYNHRARIARGAGLAQTAALELLDEPPDTRDVKDPAVMQRLACADWNVCQDAWDQFDPLDPPGLVHVKSELRAEILSDNIRPRWPEIHDFFKRYEREGNRTP